ncbi:MAG: hypothetical protein JWM82_1103 [Myxococcales bacterium]|nr:hypothetical protein [Myxococcales bacterium]
MERLARAGRWMVSLLLATVVTATASCGSDVMTAAQVRDACRKDPTSKCCATSDCATGWVCDFSFVCGQHSDHQVGCDLGEGDRQCHAPCDVATPCATGQTCARRSLYDASDAGKSVSFCVAP